MTKLDPVGFPIPKDHVLLMDALISVVGKYSPLTASDDELATYGGHMTSLWADVWGQLISEDFVCYATKPGFGLQPLRGADWTHQTFNRPPLTIQWAFYPIAPLVRLQDIPVLATMWRENDLHPASSEDDDDLISPLDRQVSRGSHAKFSKKVAAETAVTLIAETVAKGERLRREDFEEMMRERTGASATAARELWSAHRPDEWSRRGPRGGQVAPE